MTDLQTEVLRCYVAADQERIFASADDIAAAACIEVEDARRARDFLTGAGLLTKVNSSRRRIPHSAKIRARIAALVG